VPSARIRGTFARKRVAPARFAMLIMVAAGILFAGCATQTTRPQSSSLVPPRPLPPGTSIEGIASWYGRASMVIALPAAPFTIRRLDGGVVALPARNALLVTNPANDHAVEVTINDHGPYVKGRQIDLSRKAARVLGVIGPGTLACAWTCLRRSRWSSARRALLRSGRFLCRSR